MNGPRCRVGHVGVFLLENIKEQKRHSLSLHTATTATTFTALQEGKPLRKRG
jgi:hypothetical protein